MAAATWLGFAVPISGDPTGLALVHGPTGIQTERAALAILDVVVEAGEVLIPAGPARGEALQSRRQAPVPEPQLASPGLVRVQVEAWRGASTVWLKWSAGIIAE